VSAAPPHRTEYLNVRREAGSLRRRGFYVTSRVRCAARYAALVGCSIAVAASVFRVSAGGAWLAWGRIYPLIEQPRRATAAERALDLMTRGISPAEAAARTRISVGKAYGIRRTAAIRQRQRRAA
jgi:hypothetical protein